MKYEKGKNDSYLHNSLLIRRENDPSPTIFHQDADSNVFARLNGYAIIPMKQYCALTGKPYNDESIKKADAELWGKSVEISEK